MGKEMARPHPLTPMQEAPVWVVEPGQRKREEKTPGSENKISAAAASICPGSSMTTCVLSPSPKRPAEPRPSFRGQRFSPDTPLASASPSPLSPLPLCWLSLPAQHPHPARGEHWQLELGTRWQSHKQQ